MTFIQIQRFLFDLEAENQTDTQRRNQNSTHLYGVKDMEMGQEDPLEKEMATHSSILAWSIPWTGEPGRLQPMGLKRVRRY